MVVIRDSIKEPALSHRQSVISYNRWLAYKNDVPDIHRGSLSHSSETAFRNLWVRSHIVRFQSKEKAFAWKSDKNCSLNLSVGNGLYPGQRHVQRGMLFLYTSLFIING